MLPILFHSQIRKSKVHCTYVPLKWEKKLVLGLEALALAVECSNHFVSHEKLSLQNNTYRTTISNQIRIIVTKMTMQYNNNTHSHSTSEK